MTSARDVRGWRPLFWRCLSLQPSFPVSRALDFVTATFPCPSQSIRDEKSKQTHLNKIGREISCSRARFLHQKSLTMEPGACHTRGDSTSLSFYLSYTCLLIERTARKDKFVPAACSICTKACTGGVFSVNAGRKKQDAFRHMKPKIAGNKQKRKWCQTSKLCFIQSGRRTFSS